MFARGFERLILPLERASFFQGRNETPFHFDQTEVKKEHVSARRRLFHSYDFVDVDGHGAYHVSLV